MLEPVSSKKPHASLREQRMTSTGDQMDQKEKHFLNKLEICANMAIRMAFIDNLAMEGIPGTTIAPQNVQITHPNSAMNVLGSFYSSGGG